MSAVEPPLENTEAPLFHLETGNPDIALIAPRSFDEVETFLRQERTYWDWCLQPPARNVPDVNRQLHQLDNCLNAVAQAKVAQQNNQNYDQQLRHIETWLRERFVQFHALISTSPRANFLASIPDKTVAAHALRCFLGFHVVNAQDPLALKGTVQAIAFDAGLAPQVPKANQDSLDQLRKTLSAEHENLRKSAGQLRDQFEALAREVGALHEQQQKTFDETQASRDTQFKELIATSAASLQHVHHGSQEKLNQIEETYNRKMSLQAAVTYLRDKAKAHLWIASIMGVISIAWGVVFAFIALRVGSELLAGDKPNWRNVAVAVLTATLCFWLLRILVRIFLSNLHLATDSRNRRTLMQTYLALLAEGGGMQTDDRELVLKMLFRPFSDGVVKDDAVPPSVWDVVTRAVGGGGRG